MWFIHKIKFPSCDKSKTVWSYTRYTRKVFEMLLTPHNLSSLTLHRCAYIRATEQYLHVFELTIPICIDILKRPFHTINFQRGKKTLLVNELKVCGSGGVAPRINLATALWGVRFIPWELYPREELLVPTVYEVGCGPVTVWVFRRRVKPLDTSGTRSMVISLSSQWNGHYTDWDILLNIM